MTGRLFAYTIGGIQLDEILAYCQQLGQAPANTFDDEGKAQTQLWLSRPAGALLLAGLATDDAVVTVTPAICARGRDLVHDLEVFHSKGVDLIVGGDFGEQGVAYFPGQPASDGTIKAMLAAASLRRPSRASAIRAGIQARKAEGRRWNAWAGYGYRWDGLAGQQRRVPDEEERATIRRIIELHYRQGLSFYRIASLFMQERVCTADGREWSPDRCRRACRWAAAFG